MIDRSILKFDNNRLLSEIVGPNNKNLKYIEKHYQIPLSHKGNQIEFQATPEITEKISKLLHELYHHAEKGHLITNRDIDVYAKLSSGEDGRTIKNIYFQTPKLKIFPKTPQQKKYIELIKSKNMVFCAGPAGTGKTFLAVAAAVSALKKKEVDRIILSRPAVEAGEKIGFLPGDMKEKLDPYFRPIYDSLQAMLDADRLKHHLETGTIEIAPLAFMRGRTLANAFIILDEAQNTTVGQMKMFLTRLGENSHMIITGDPTQNDLMKHEKSGFEDAIKRLKNISKIGFIPLSSADIVRHLLVADIIEAYS
ncbi:MAG: phosphate starvation-inducible protein PhoH [Rickettsiales bacterium]|nr:phosphate starvation-inducible protein PhoH [Rickettsiales bacterium]|tara:strand:- start:17753 stop:18679 length:927 start_codon:yes stop_codon:yes gene_type:complete